MIKIKKFSFFIIFCISMVFHINAQSIDTLKTKSIFKKSIIPASLIVVGSFISNSDFEKKLQIDLRNNIGNDYKNKIDNYLLFAPIVEMYVADILKVKSKNHWFDQSKNLFISNIISTVLTSQLKVITNKTRPNGDRYSFPSGHTTIAFTNASVLFHEFKDSSKILAYSGFAFATVTGGFRMLNNKHFISDVLVAAGIGILVTDLVYYFEPLKSFNPFKKVKNISFVPQILDGKYGVYFAYQF